MTNVKRYLFRLSAKVIEAMDAGRDTPGRLDHLERIARRNIIRAGYSPEMAGQLVADAFDRAETAYEFTF